MIKQAAREAAKLEKDRRKRKAQTVTALKTAVAVGGLNNV